MKINFYKNYENDNFKNLLIIARAAISSVAIIKYLLFCSKGQTPVLSIEFPRLTIVSKLILNCLRILGMFRTKNTLFWISSSAITSFSSSKTSSSELSSELESTIPASRAAISSSSFSFFIWSKSAEVSKCATIWRPYCKSFESANRTI